MNEDHPLKKHKLKKKPSSSDIEEVKRKAKELFSVRIKEIYNDRTACYDFGHGRNFSCDCYKKVIDEDNLDKLSKFMGDLAVKSAADKRTLINEIIGAGASNHDLLHTPHHSAPAFVIKLEESKITLRRHTGCKVLNAGRKKYENIVKRYVNINGSKDGRLGRSLNKSDIKTKLKEYL